MGQMQRMRRLEREAAGKARRKVTRAQVARLADGYCIAADAFGRFLFVDCSAEQRMLARNLAVRWPKPR